MMWQRGVAESGNISRKVQGGNMLDVLERKKGGSMP